MTYFSFRRLKMKVWKFCLVVLMSVLAVFSFTACSGDSGSTDDTGSSGNAGGSSGTPSYISAVFESFEPTTMALIAHKDNTWYMQNADGEKLMWGKYNGLPTEDGTIRIEVTEISEAMKKLTGPFDSWNEEQKKFSIVIQNEDFTINIGGQERQFSRSYP